MGSWDGGDWKDKASVGDVADIGSFGTMGLGQAFDATTGTPTLGEVGANFQSGLDALSGKTAAEDAQAAMDEQAEANRQLQRELAAEQARQFDIMREDYAPYRELGAAQLPMLQEMARGGEPSPTMQGFYGSPESQIGNIQDFRADPGYQFQLQEGLNAIQNSAAARGGLESGRAMKEMQRYGQGLADQTYNQWYGRRAGEFGSYANRLGSQYGNQFNRLAALSGIGQTATGATSQLGQNQLAMQQQGTQNLMNINNQMGQVNSAAAMQPYNSTMNMIGQGAMLYALSDERAKENIEDSGLGLEFIKQLRPVRWKYKGKDGTHDGLIAQELKQALEKAGVDGEMHVDGDLQGIRYGELIGPLIKAVQELSDRLEAQNG